MQRLLTFAAFVRSRLLRLQIELVFESRNSHAHKRMKLEVISVLTRRRAVEEVAHHFLFTPTDRTRRSAVPFDVRRF